MKTNMMTECESDSSTCWRDFEELHFLDEPSLPCESRFATRKLQLGLVTHQHNVKEKNLPGVHLRIEFRFS